MFAKSKPCVYYREMNAIEQAIEIAGGQARLARQLGVVPMAVSQWKRRGQVPASRCLAVEEATGVSRFALRPDVFGSLRDTATAGQSVREVA